MSDDPINLGRASVVRATSKALLCRLDSSGDEVWVPFSQIHDDSEVYLAKSPPGDLIVSAWWAEKAGLD